MIAGAGGEACFLRFHYAPTPDGSALVWEVDDDTPDPFWHSDRTTVCVLA